MNAHERKPLPLAPEPEYEDPQVWNMPPRGERGTYIQRWLAAHYRFRLRRKLGRGCDREAWLTRDGRVLKLWRRDDCTEICGGGAQTESEWECMVAGKADSMPMARGELVYLCGVPHILMEYVTQASTLLDAWDRDMPRLPKPHRLAFEYDRPYGLPKRKGWVTDDQWGWTHDGRAVCYDAGLASPPEEASNG